EGARLAPAQMVRQRIEGRAPELALVNQSGQPLTLMELRGKVVLLTFTYSTCAEVCPLITAAMVTLQQRLTAAERQQVFFLSGTAQPKAQPPALPPGLAPPPRRRPRPRGFLDGAPEGGPGSGQGFGAEGKAPPPGVVNHPAWTFLIDREGMVQYR